METENASHLHPFKKNQNSNVSEVCSVRQLQLNAEMRRFADAPVDNFHPVSTKQSLDIYRLVSRNAIGIAGWVAKLSQIEVSAQLPT